MVEKSRGERARQIAAILVFHLLRLRGAASRRWQGFEFVRLAEVHFYLSKAVGQ